MEIPENKKSPYRSYPVRTIFFAFIKYPSSPFITEKQKTPHKRCFFKISWSKSLENWQPAFLFHGIKLLLAFGVARDGRDGIEVVKGILREFFGGLLAGGKHRAGQQHGEGQKDG